MDIILKVFFCKEALSFHINGDSQTPVKGHFLDLFLEHVPLCQEGESSLGSWGVECIVLYYFFYFQIF